MNITKLNGKPVRLVGTSAVLAMALSFLLTSAGRLHAQEQPEAVSRAEYEALRQEVDALRAEIAAVRGDVESAVVDVGKPTAPVNDARRSEPAEPIPPVATWDRFLTFNSPDDRFSLTIRGRVQPRYEYERREGQNDHSSFSLRRVRLDFRGHAYTGHLTYRIMPEWGRTGTLRDAWANYQFNDFTQLRLGQFNTPFAWERDSSSNLHQFVERSVANNEFEWNDGRDLGVMFHGNLSEQVRYGIGVFGGEGREVRRTSSTGNLYMGRISFTPAGNYPDAEAIVQPVSGTNLAFGLGAGYNTKNTPRPGSTSLPWQNANVFGATADAHFQIDRLSTHLIGFYRDVDLRAAGSSFDGYGYTLQAGYLLMPDLLFGNLRYSRSEPNTGQNAGKQREFMGGLQIFQFGHGAKIQVEAGRIQSHNGSEWIDTDIFRSQYQILF